MKCVLSIKESKGSNWVKIFLVAYGRVLKFWMKFQSRLELNKSPWDKDLSKWLRATFVWRGHSNLESFPENSIPTLKILKASSSSLCCRDDAFIAGDDSKLKSLAQTQFPWAAKSQCHRRGRWQDLKVCRKMSKSQLAQCDDMKTSLFFLCWIEWLDGKLYDYWSPSLPHLLYAKIKIVWDFGIWFKYISKWTNLMFLMRENCSLYVVKIESSFSPGK